MAYMPLRTKFKIFNMTKNHHVDKDSKWKNLNYNIVDNGVCEKLWYGQSKLDEFGVQTKYFLQNGKTKIVM